MNGIQCELVVVLQKRVRPLNSADRSLVTASGTFKEQDRFGIRIGNNDLVILVIESNRM